MQIVWDERKRAENLRKHGLDFAALTPGYFLEAIITPAKKGRLKALGYLPSGQVAAIFVRLGSEGISVISLRAASRSERKDYAQTEAPTHH